jgi:hypothetical protein
MWSVSVLEDLRDNSIPETINIWQAGTCSEFLINNEGKEAMKGDTVLFLAESLRIDTGMYKNSYHIYSCRWVDMKYKNGSVKGPINAIDQSMDLGAFREFVRWGYIADFNCQKCYCECFLKYPISIPDTTFCWTKKLALYKTSDLIIAKISIDGFDRHGMIGSIKDLIKGYEPKKHMKIWGQYGSDCRESPHTFSKDQEYVMILYRLDQDNTRSADENEGDYEIASCGRHHLPIVDDTVTGPIAGKIFSMPYETFYNQVRNDFKDIRNCEDWIVSAEDIQNDRNVSIFPNPSFLGSTIVSAHEGIKKITIYTSSGTLVDVISNVHTNEISLDLSKYREHGQVFILDIISSDTHYIEKVVRL